MKVAILAQGSRGDVQPYCALALELQARGHTVRLAANENFKGFVEACGVGFASIPGNSREMVEDPEGKRHLMNGNALRFLARMVKLARPLWPSIRKALDEACQGADLILGTAVIDHLSVLLARRHNAKLILSYLAPAQPSRAHAPAMLFTHAPSLGPLNAPLHALTQWGWWRVNLEALRSAAADWGMKGPHFNELSPSRRAGIPTLLGYSPVLFEPSLADEGPNFVLSGHWPLPSATAQALPGDHHDVGFQHWLEEGTPPVFFGFGSMPVLHPEALIELAGEACERLGMRGVIGAGWTDLDLADCDLPDDIALAGACDYEWLFSHCAAILHHAGSGTTHTASLAGVPQVACPVFADQPFWAGRVKELGLGAVLPFQRLSAQGVASALLDALAEPVQERSAGAAARLRQEQGLARAAQALETWARA